jgi:regulator of sigma E protease
LSIIISILLFLVSISILVAAHEWGHFIVARCYGVKVQRFSIGFGKVIWRKVTRSGLEIAISAIPLGGYVKFLDESEAKLALADRPFTFNRQSIFKRMAIVIAGPFFNFLFAIAAFWLMFMIGIHQVKPIIGEVVPHSLAAKAGFLPKQRIVAINDEKVASWQDIRLALYAKLAEDKPILVSVRGPNDVASHSIMINVSGIRLDENNVDILEDVGVFPFALDMPAIVDQVEPQSPAAALGLRQGDKIVSVNGQPINHWQQLLGHITGLGGQTISLTILRNGAKESLSVALGKRIDHQGEERGYLGVRAKALPLPKSLLVVKRYGPLAAIPMALHETWRMTSLTVNLIYKMITRKIGSSGIGGPIGIVEGMGIVVYSGLAAYLSFLALLSIGLGIVNILPIPVLDGGYLFYFLLEIVRGKPLSERAQFIGIKIGFFILFTLLLLASYNDIMRLLQ